MTQAEFAKKEKFDLEEVIASCKVLGIENIDLDTQSQNEIWRYINKNKLNDYREKIREERDKLKQDKLTFKTLQKDEENQFKEKLLSEELSHKTKLEEEKIKVLSQLKEDFLIDVKSEYEQIKLKLNNITTQEIKLTEREQEIDNTKMGLIKEKELFESQKESILSEYHQELEKDKEIFYNKLEEERVKKLEETNKIIEKLYEDKATELEKQEEEIREKHAQLKTKIAEVKAKEKALELQEDSLYKQAQEKIELEIKNYQEKVKAFEKQNQSLMEELSDLREELDSYERFENRDLSRELDEKQQELSRLNTLLVETTKIKNSLSVSLDKKELELQREIESFENEKNRLLQDNLKTETLKSTNMGLEDRVTNLTNELIIIKGERDAKNEELKSKYSDGTEIEEIIRKQEPYNEIKLEAQISITDEIKYLDSIEDNMKKYGVEYPKRLLYAFHTALKSAEFSPLAVLSGVSGTGKSKLPELYSHFGGFNFLVEAVQPTWDSPESMIGYYNTIERAFDSTNILKFLLQTSQSKNESPYGLKESMNMILLDEMNLAYIERYFAEFLSKFELRRGSVNGDVNIDVKLLTGRIYKLPLDRNVLWIGTMNEDETTKSLSDKVLDRAFSINFPRPTELKSRAKLQKLHEIKQFEYLHRDTWNKWIQKDSLFTGDKSDVLDEFNEISNQINEYLAPTGRAIGHRVWQSMEYYMSNHPLVIKNIDDNEEFVKNAKLAFEEQLVQKIMPKLRGIEVHGKEKDALMNIKDILDQKEFNITEDFKLSMENPYGQFIWNSANYLKED